MLKILYFFLYIFIIREITGGQDEESCDPALMRQCLKTIPRAPLGLPKNKSALDAYCTTFYKGMECLDNWMKRCIPNDNHYIIYQQTEGSRSVMKHLCSETSPLRKEYLEEGKCWTLIATDWDICKEDHKKTLVDIENLKKNNAYFHEEDDICCTREVFQECVRRPATTVCSTKAISVISRMAIALSQDDGTRIICARKRGVSYCSNSFKTGPEFLLAMLVIFVGSLVT